MFQVTAGDMFFLWPGVPHKFQENAEDPWSFDWVRVEGPGCEGFGRAWGASAETPVIRVHNLQKAHEGFFALLDYFGHPARVAHEAVSLLFNLLAVTAPAEDQADDGDPADFHHLVRHAEIIFETHLHEGLNINQLTQHLEVSRATLWRAFQEERHMSPLQALQQARLHRARELLQRPDLKIHEIARLSGFRNEKYFQRWFRKRTGSPPGLWRKLPS
jgi:AraC-like DNA-binding protein